VEIGQEFVIHPFDNLQGGKGEWPKTSFKGALNLHLTTQIKNYQK
jgi:hypothetical protein